MVSIRLRLALRGHCGTVPGTSTVVALPATKSFRSASLTATRWFSSERKADVHRTAEHRLLKLPQRGSACIPAVSNERFCNRRVSPASELRQCCRTSGRATNTARHSTLPANTARLQTSFMSASDRSGGPPIAELSTRRLCAKRDCSTCVDTRRSRRHRYAEVRSGKIRSVWSLFSPSVLVAMVGTPSSKEMDYDGTLQ